MAKRTQSLKVKKALKGRDFSVFKLPNDSSIYSTYMHNHRSTFIATVLEHKFDTIFDSIEKIQSKLQVEFSRWIKEIESVEEEFISDFSESLKKQRMSRSEVIDLLTKSLSDDKILIPYFKGYRERVEKGTKKGSTDEETVDLIKGYLFEMTSNIEQFLLNYRDKISGSNKFSGNYGTSFQGLESFLKQYKKGLEEFKTKKDWSDFFGRFIKETPRMMGWLLEVAKANALGIVKKDLVRVVGSEYSGGIVSTVIDLEFNIDSIKKFGINVKSHKEKYEINRKTSDDYIEKMIKQKNIWRYLNRNFIALKNYKTFEFGENPSFYHNNFMELYKKFILFEKNAAFLSEIISALDGVREENSSNKNIYSVLISTPNGFVWTSEFAREVEKELPSFLKGESTREIFKAKFELNSLDHKSDNFMNKMYTSKRIQLRKIKQEATSNEEIYAALNKVVKDKQIDLKPIVRNVRYTFMIGSFIKK